MSSMQDRNYSPATLVCMNSSICFTCIFCLKTSDSVVFSTLFPVCVSLEQVFHAKEYTQFILGTRNPTQSCKSKIQLY